MNTKLELRGVMVVAAIVALAGWIGCSSGSEDDDDDDGEDACSADSDCKGDRVCDDGECVDPSGPSTTTSSTGGSLTTTSTTTTTTTATTGPSTSSGPIACELPGTPAPSTCNDACEILYDCGVLVCSGQQNCPGFDGSSQDRSLFVQGCIDGCNAQQALISIVDPSSCDTTIDTIKSVNASFAGVCDNGI